MLILLINHIVPNEDHDGNFLDFTFGGELESELVCSSIFNLRNLESGAMTTLMGSGMGISANGEEYFGTVTNWETWIAPWTKVTQISGISWGLAEVVEALTLFLNMKTMSRFCSC